MNLNRISYVTYCYFQSYISQLCKWSSPGGVLLGRVVSPGSPNPDPISDQKIVNFHNRFQTWRQQKISQNSFRIRIFDAFFLICLELKRQIRLFTLVFPQKPYPNSDQNRQSLYPFSDQTGSKNHTYCPWGRHIPIRKYKGVPPGDTVHLMFDNL